MQVSCRFNYLILAAAQFIDYLFFHDSNQSVGRLKVHFNGIRPIEHLFMPFPYRFHHHILLSILSFNYLIFQCWMQSASFLLITVKLWWFDQLYLDQTLDPSNPILFIIVLPQFFKIWRSNWQFADPCTQLFFSLFRFLEKDL